MTFFNHTVRIQGRPWPESIGDFKLMGPVNALGAWRWYQHGGERVKVDWQLQPVYYSRNNP